MDRESLRRQLADTKEAIAKIKRGGQEVQTRNGRRKMADLELLLAEQARLERQLADADGLGDGGFDFVPVTYYGRR